MKFYIDTDLIIYWHIIKINKLTAIYSTEIYVEFFKDGNSCNAKNASFIKYNGDKQFWLNNQRYGYKKDFTKQSWRRFVKLQAFL